MNRSLYIKAFVSQVKFGTCPEISVVGSSMEPTLIEGDRIAIKKKKEYDVGDILVFLYKHNELLVHRLLRKESGLYLCKGDNAFRLEDIEYSQIVGCVTSINGFPPFYWNHELLELSYAVNRAFVKCQYNICKTKQTDIYKAYMAKICNEDYAYVQDF